MPYSPADSALLSPLFSDGEIASIFSDEQFVLYLLEVEAALARVEGRAGLIPAEAARQIPAAIKGMNVDFGALQRGTAADGFPIIELVRQIRSHAGEGAADYVHWGATTQDIMDTALILQVGAALDVLEANLRKTIRTLAAVAERHRNTLMAGRTHSQQALPITFGFKVAGWLAPLLRHRQRLAELRPRLLVVQLGGAVGTLAALGDAGPGIQAGLAEELRLSVPVMPWHTQRDNLAELAGWLSLVSGGLAKCAQDIILLAQTEIGEIREAAARTRSGSSTMPQKNNPIISELIVAAARTNAALLASMHQSLVQEHERGTGGWQMEWLALPQMIGLTGAALQKSIFLAENLLVNEARMLKNVQASNGLMLAERISFALTQSMGRAAAEKLVREACVIAEGQGRHLLDVVREQSTAPVNWTALSDEADYLGAAQEFIDRVLEAAGA